MLCQDLPGLFQLLPGLLIRSLLFLRFGFLLLQFFQPVVLLQPVLFHVKPRFLLLRFRFTAPRRFQLLLSLLRRGLKFRPLLPGLFQRLFPLFLFFRRQNPGRQGIQLPSQKLLLLLPFFQPYSGLIPEFLNRLKVLLVPKPAPVRFFRKPCPFLLEADFPHQVVVRLPRLTGLLLQALLQPGIPAGAENTAENLPPLLRLGQQQLEKIPLGNHGNLHELIPGHPQNLPNFLVHLSGAGEDLSPRQPQLRRCVLLGHALASQLRPLIGRIPANLIFFIAVGKNKFHLRGGIRLRIAGTQHIAAPPVAAGGSVKCEDDGIENGGFTRPRIPGNQVDAAGPQPVHFYGLFAGVRSEGGHLYANRSHTCSSQISRISPSRYSFRSESISCPFCCSYNAANSSPGVRSSTRSSCSTSF